MAACDGKQFVVWYLLLRICWTTVGRFHTWRRHFPPPPASCFPAPPAALHLHLQVVLHSTPTAGKFQKEIMKSKALYQNNVQCSPDNWTLANLHIPDNLHICMLPNWFHWLWCMDNSHILLNSQFSCIFCANYLVSTVINVEYTNHFDWVIVPSVLQHEKNFMEISDLPSWIDQ